MSAESLAQAAHGFTLIILATLGALGVVHGGQVLAGSVRGGRPGTATRPTASTHREEVAPAMNEQEKAAHRAGLINAFVAKGWTRSGAETVVDGWLRDHGYATVPMEVQGVFRRTGGT